MAPAVRCLLLVTTLLMLSKFTYTCMSGDDSIDTSFQLDGICYWVVSPKFFTSWEFAKEICALNGGVIATVNSGELNGNISSRLSRSVFIGLYKANDFSWEWVNGSGNGYDKVKGTEGEVSVTSRVSLTPDGRWVMVSPNPEEENVYGSLCAIDMESLRCPDIGEVENAYVLSGDVSAYYAGDSINYQCKREHQANPFGKMTQTAECLLGQRWSTEIHHCSKRPQCIEPPPLLANATVTIEDDYNLTVAKYVCLKGWGFNNGEDVVLLTCSPNSDWNETALLSVECEEKVCKDDITLNPNQFVSTQSLQVGVTRSYWCHYGFRMGNENPTLKAEATCVQPSNKNKDPDWDVSRVPLCESVSCPVLEVPYANMNGREEDGENARQVVGQSVILQCTGNRRFPGGLSQQQTTCKEDGRWENEPPLSGCTAGVCQAGWDGLLNSCYYRSNHTQQGLRYTSAMLSCREKLAYLATVNDEMEKDLYYSTLYDNYGVDYWIGLHKQNGEWIWHDPDGANYTNFRRGYPELYDCARTAISGYWKDWNCDTLLPYICEKPAVCGRPPDVRNTYNLYMLLNGIEDSDKVEIEAGTTVQYICKDDYALQDGGKVFNSTCITGGYWSAVPNCQKIQCISVNAPKMIVNNSYVKMAAGRDGNAVNSKVVYTCNNGYAFPNGEKSITIRCLNDGKWSEIPEKCEAITCPIQRDPHAAASSNNTGYGDTNLFTCDEGYAFPDGRVKKALFCDTHGKWSPYELCEAVRCPQYYQSNADVDKGSVSYGERVTVTCKTGYRLDNTEHETQKVMTCTADTTWKGSQAACIARNCPGPTPPDVNKTYRSNNAILGGTKVMYMCYRYFVFEDGTTSHTAWCSADTLQWENVPQACIDYETYMKSQLFVYPDKFVVTLVFYGNVGVVSFCILLAILQTLSILLDYPVVKAMNSNPTVRLTSIQPHNDLELEIVELPEGVSREHNYPSASQLLRESRADTLPADVASVGATSGHAHTPERVSSGSQSTKQSAEDDSKKKEENEDRKSSSLKDVQDDVETTL